MQHNLFEDQNDQQNGASCVPLDKFVSKPVLLHGDCLKLMFDLPDNSVDMVCCDMPYGTTACKWDAVLPLDMLWHHYDRIVKDNGAIVLFASQPFTTSLISSNIKMFKVELIWKKERPTNPLLCKKQPPKYHENICVFYKKQPCYNPTMIQRKPSNKRNNTPRNYKDATKVNTEKYAERVLSGSNDLIYQPNILEVPMQRGKHPTQKPVALIEYLIKTYTNEGDTVLDNCMGSGTTGVACKNLNREFIGIELDDNYYQIATKRIEAC